MFFKAKSIFQKTTASQGVIPVQDISSISRALAEQSTLHIYTQFHILFSPLFDVLTSPVNTGTQL